MSSPDQIKLKTPLEIGGCELWPMPSFEDKRGDLMALEFSEDLPFQPQRCFFVHHVPNDKLRGEHAHKECDQFLVAIHGKLSIMFDDGQNRKDVILDRPSTGLYIPAKVWATQYNFSSDAVLMVFASHPYEADDYIREYSEFLKYAQRNN